MPRDDEDDGIEQEEEEEEVEVEEEVEMEEEEVEVEEEEMEEEEAEEEEAASEEEAADDGEEEVLGDDAAEGEGEDNGGEGESEELMEEDGGVLQQEEEDQGFHDTPSDGVGGDTTGKEEHSPDIEALPEEIPLDQHAKDMDIGKSTSTREVDGVGNHAESVTVAVPTVELDHGRSSVSKPIEYLGNLPLSGPRGVSSEGLDHRRSPVSAQWENLGKNATYNLDSVGTAGYEYRISTASRQIDNLGIHARPTLIRSRSPSADAAHETGNKRPSLICDFYAKGWCIKGSSCRFLHLKDEPLKMTSAPAFGQESRNALEHPSPSHALVRAYGEQRPQIPYTFEENGSEKARRSDLEPKLGISSESVLRKGSITSGNPSISEQIYSSIGSSVSSRMSGPFSYNSRDWDLTAPKNASRFESGNSYTSPREYQSSKWTQGMLSTDYQADSHKGFSLADKKPRLSSAWQPSVPFRSSFCSVPSSLLSSGDQYDPLIDSIEPSKGNADLPGLQRPDHIPRENASPGYNQFKLAELFSLTRERKTEIAYGKEHVISVGTTSAPALTDGGNGHSTLDRLMNSPVHVPISPSAYFEMRERNLKVKEDKGTLDGLKSPDYVPYHVYSPNIKKEMQQRNSKVQEDKSTLDGPKSPVYVPYHVYDPNMKKEIQEKNSKVQEDKGNSHKESKALKVFRASVADFVKDLLKPSWLGGHLSKDAHKVIVKKVVEKVCSALQPHQIPNSNETTNQYFFSNRPKLVKLVEGYVEKYVKL